MATNYPGSLDTGTEQPSPSASTEMDDAGFEHDVVHTNHSEAIIALETKVGVGSSTPVAGSVLTGTGSGTSEWSNAPLYVDTTNNKVAINATSFGAEFEVHGSSNPELRIRSTDASDPALVFGDAVDAARASILYDTSEDRLHFRGYDNTNRMVIDSSGNVGIGTTTPGQALHVNSGNTNTTAVFESNDGTAIIGIRDSASSSNIHVGVAAIGDDLRLRAGNAYRVHVDNDGNVGIGETNPSYKLDVNGTGRFTGQLTSDSYRWGGTSYLTSTTTSALESELLARDVFDSSFSAFKTGWSYAGNGDLTDAGRLTELAGTSWLTWTDNSADNTLGNYTALVIAPTTGGSGGGVFVYNDQGSSYSPGWRELWNSSRTIVGPDGSAGAPAYSFADDTNTGMYSDGSDSISFATGGTQRLDVDGGGIKGKVTFSAPFGSAAAPGFSFDGDTDTGFYRYGSGTIGWSGNNNTGGYLHNSGIRTDNGNASYPAYSFTGDTNTGMYRTSSDRIGFACGGALAAEVRNDGIHLASGDWFRSYGSTGWYNGTYGGGWNMTDTSWIRAYGSKGIVVPGGMVATLATHTSTTGYKYVQRNTTYGTLSQYNSSRDFKDNITNVTASDAAAWIDSLQPVTFVSKWMSEEEEPEEARAWREADVQVGFIAEDVLANSTSSQFAQVEDVDGTLKGAGWKWECVIAAAVAEIKSLRTRVADLEAA